MTHQDSFTHLLGSSIKLVHISRHLVIPDLEHVVFSLSLVRTNVRAWKVFLHISNGSKRVKVEFDLCMRITDFPSNLNIPISVAADPKALNLALADRMERDARLKVLRRIPNEALSELRFKLLTLGKEFTVTCSLNKARGLIIEKPVEY